jgi:hypothetical protein
MGSHAFFAPSSAPRVVACPGSLLLTAGMPDTQSVDAAHGTAAHWIADLCLRHRKPVNDYAGCEVAVSDKGECRFRHEKNRKEIALELAFGKAYLFGVDDEMVVAVQEYVDWCNDAPGEKYPECRVDISPWCPQVSDNAFVPAEAFEPQGGTSDHAACTFGRLIITDLKYGKGVKVFAEMNYQAVLYALGFIAQWDWLYDFEEIEIRICQPRLDHKDVWIVSREEIEEIGRYILERFTLALQPDAPFAPGEKQCKFCKASGLCRAQKEYLSEIRALAFDDLDAGETPAFAEPDPRLLTEAELVEAWRVHGLYKARFDAIEREMLKALQNGVALPGVKLVMSKTNRAWSKPDDVIADDIEFATGLSKEKLFSAPSLISPAQVEKLLPKREREIVNTLAYKPRGGPCIADENDKRPNYEEVIEAQVAGVFDDLDEDPFA